MVLRRIQLDRVDSTNQYLARVLQSGKPAGELLVLADYQEHGKGQGKNRWESRTGENLLMSVLLRPAFLSAQDQFHLSRLASLALFDTLEHLGLMPVIKWPNDILVGKRKIAGILIENGITGSRLSHTIMGFGLNLNQTAFPVYPIPATSVAMEGLTGILPAMAASLLEASLITRYERLGKGEVAGMKRDYLKYLMWLDRPGEFISGELRFRGIIRGVDASGQLVVEHGGSRVAYAQGQIGFVL
jgi:BirA family biotin operon repressor/biotin-[acetyl-CoA-carboxylase] ligase